MLETAVYPLLSAINQPSTWIHRDMRTFADLEFQARNVRGVWEAFGPAVLGFQDRLARLARVSAEPTTRERFPRHLTCHQPTEVAVALAGCRADTIRPPEDPSAALHAMKRYPWDSCVSIRVE
jgi:hypothetical protein